MPTSLRLVILAGSLLIIANVLNYIHKRRILMANSTGWVVIAFLLLLMAIFPNSIIWLSAKLGFISPANFVFFIVTGLLTVKTFRDSARMSLMRRRAPSANWRTEHWQAEMRKIEDCINCRQCAERCPYELPTPELLKENWKDYQAVLAGEVQV